MNLKKISITDNQIKYIQENYNRMSTFEMARNLKISQMKVYKNMTLMGLRSCKAKREKVEAERPSGKFFRHDPKLSTI